MSELPTIHLPGLFHTMNDQRRHSSCAFTGKIRRFPKMMKPFGWKCIDYSNGISESKADEHVQMLTVDEFNQYYPEQKPTDFHGSYAMIGARGYPLFDMRLKLELSRRVKQGDFIVHSFGRAHAELVPMFPQCNHVELFIGYPDFPFNAWRCFESECWRHYHWGRDDAKPEFQGNRGLNKMYSAVVPNFYDLADWDLGDGSGDYVLFMGRICAEKGINTILDIIKAWFQDVKEGEREPVKFVFAGQGDYENLVRIPLSGLGALLTSHVEYRGVVQDRDRSDLIGKARCMLMPTNFIEPLGGSGVEAQLCGTPLVAVNYGAFTETINHGVSGYRCNTMGDWLEAIEAAKHLHRPSVCLWARTRYSLEACAPQFHAFLMQISDLWKTGWYEKDSYRVPCYRGPITQQENPS